jgi:hypothetical protein
VCTHSNEWTLTSQTQKWWLELPALKCGLTLEGVWQGEIEMKFYPEPLAKRKYKVLLRLLPARQTDRLAGVYSSPKAQLSDISTTFLPN